MGKWMKNILGGIGKGVGSVLKTVAPIPFVSNFYGDIGSWAGETIGEKFRRGGAVRRPRAKKAKAKGKKGKRC